MPRGKEDSHLCMKRITYEAALGHGREDFSFQWHECSHDSHMWVRTEQPLLLRAKTHLVLWMSVTVKVTRDGGFPQPLRLILIGIHVSP